MDKIDLIDAVFGSITVLNMVPKEKGVRPKYNCLCNCGKYKKC